MIPPVNLSGFWEWADAKPFPHVAIDNFFEPSFARELAKEFPSFGSDCWHVYASALEEKKTCNSWNEFGPNTYRAFSWLNSPDFVELLRLSIHHEGALYSDPGLHGGGLHAHAIGGKLNTHLDYVRHPKTGMQRKLNLLVYLNEDWEDDWGGHLGLWEQNPVQPGPGALVKSIAPRFNRAVLFDTTQQSWHGLPEPIRCPPGQIRKSLAVYYMADASHETEERTRALFAPAPGQEHDAAILQLIERRADERTVGSAYRVHG